MRSWNRLNSRTDNTAHSRVGDFYESHPYPPPVDDIERYRRRWDDQRRRVDSHLFWPSESYRDDRSILVAGCGTSQAAHYAVRWPNARIVGVDLSGPSIAFERELKRKYGLDNLELHELPVERAGELGESFDHVVCTGVLHHLPDPDAGLRALRNVLAPRGALHLMVYAPYGRAGVYMLQEYCRRLRIDWSDAEIDELAASLKALPPDHPIVSLLHKSRDFETKAGVADALLHPQDRAYSVPQLMEFLDRADLVFGRWIRQAPYLPWCGAIASSPHHARLAALEPDEQYAALELFRGTMVRHSLVAYRRDFSPAVLDFSGDEWLNYVPIRLPDTLVVRDRLPRGAVAVLINRNHTFTDLYLPIDARQERLLEAIDGKRRIRDMGRAMADRDLARKFFEQLWQWDQVVFDTSKN
ncbi:MAG: class I SAM-dependent methyltransferase [Candidatus Eremiobacteraeota bacterium]|nr:class I SAM-dependent methyltransferase [Candidatus Eremiobacteraeota bacterium]MBV8344370.1 class I SAM-dependent methyltransferase [Candidatus Eremiobacteraeota bacterium]MBV8498748.1 class I SAM-dependent methyltransferase [Candidatus Eremiobacteraeota bacterium]